MYWQDATNSHLRRLVNAARFGLVTDVDGTVSPIVDDPDAAQVMPEHRRLLAALRAVATLVAVVSGRAAADVAQRVGVEGLVYVGNHGLERWENGRLHPMPQIGQYRPALEAARDAVAARAPDGMWVEDKQATLSVHYRQTADFQAVYAEYKPVIQAIAADNGLRFFEGRMIFELRPPVDADKGTAFRGLVEEYELETAVYIGDDVTDVDAMRQARHLRQSGDCYALAIGVEAATDDTPASVRQSSDLMAKGVQDVAALFAWLLDARKASSN